jgi:type VI secretion system secreted protein Hcp
VIVSIKPFMKDCLDKAADHVGQMEEVAFSYRKAIWRWIPDGIESEDDWRSPKD